VVIDGMLPGNTPTNELAARLDGFTWPPLYRLRQDGTHLVAGQ